MKDVLFIKTSSLGDVIHHMPALTEARAQRPDARFAWVVEEAFAPLVRLHPAVDEVIPVAARRWRARAAARRRRGARSAAFRRALRARTFDEIVDTQGLLKSALIARYGAGAAARLRPQEHQGAGGVLALRRAASGRVEAARDRAQPRADRPWRSATRREGPPDFGLDRASLAATGGRALRRAAARDRARREGMAGGELADAGGARSAAATSISWCRTATTTERERATRIARRRRVRACRSAQPLDGVARLIAGASFVVGVDTGLAASCGGARRAAGRDLSRQRARAHRADGAGADRGARARRARRRRWPRSADAVQRLMQPG